MRFDGRVVRVGEADRFHRAEAQSFRTARGHDFDGHAAIEVGRVFFLLFQNLRSAREFPVFEQSVFGGEKCVQECCVFFLGHRAVDVILAVACGADFIVTRLKPRLCHVDGVKMHDGGECIEEGERIFAREIFDRLGERIGGEGSGCDDDVVPVFGRQAVDLAALDCDERMIGLKALVTPFEKISLSTASAPPAGTADLSPSRMMSEFIARISACSRPTALFSASSERKELEQTSSAQPSVLWAAVPLIPRISCKITGTPAFAHCQAASLPASPAPIMCTGLCVISKEFLTKPVIIFKQYFLFLAFRERGCTIALMVMGKRE
jgi:hypothetical protein